MAATNDPLRDPDRLAAVRDAELIGFPREEVIDHLTRLAARLVDAPAALVSMLTDERQFFTSTVGFDGPAVDAGSVPLSRTICRHVVSSGTPLVVADAREDPRLRGNPGVVENGIIAYLGVPLVDAAEHTLGTLCVIDSRPRQWSDAEVETVRELARTVMSTIVLRASARASVRAAARGQDSGATGEQVEAREVRAAAVDYIDAVDRYETAMRQGAPTAEQLDIEVGHREAVARAFEVLATTQERLDAVPRADTSDDDLAAGRRRLTDAVRAYIRAEREREAASTAFMARRISLDDYQIACAAIRTPELELRQALIDTAT
jgi:GAF domain-containing protein